MEREWILAFLAVTAGVAMLVSCSVMGFGMGFSHVPQRIDGWTLDPEVRTFDRKTLFRYIDGGAELYLAYGFQKAYVYRYTRAAEPDIVMDVYDMGTPRAAFGVFTAERLGEEAGIGEGSEYDTGLLRFHKGPFFVSILAHEETPQSRPAVFFLARAVADGFQPGSKPGILSILPRHGLLENSVRYFYDPAVLNLHYYLADENILLIDEHTEALFAQYAMEGEKPYLLIIQYPSIRQADKAFTHFTKAYMPEAVENRLHTENGKWTAADQRSTFVTVVFDAASEGDARALLDAVHIDSEVSE